MLLFLNTKIDKNLDENILFSCIINYIISVAIIKFFEYKHNMIGFFNIYIILIICTDLTFSLYYYIKNHIIKISNIDIKCDDVINKKFNSKLFNEELNKFKRRNNNKIISKLNCESEAELQKFNQCRYNITSTNNITTNEISNNITTNDISNNITTNDIPNNITSLVQDIL